MQTQRRGQDDSTVFSCPSTALSYSADLVIWNCLWSSLFSRMFWRELFLLTLDGDRAAARGDKEIGWNCFKAPQVRECLQALRKKAPRKVTSEDPTSPIKSLKKYLQLLSLVSHTTYTIQHTAIGFFPPSSKHGVFFHLIFLLRP